MISVEAGADQAAGKRAAPDRAPIALRPAVPADDAALGLFCEALAPRDLRLLAAGPLTAAGFALGGRGPGSFGLVALRGREPQAETVGLARLCADPDGVAAEFALIVHPVMRRRGLGRLLLECLLSEARRRRLLLLRGAALPDNAAMLALARASRFRLLRAADGAVELVLALEPRPKGRA